VETMSPVSYQQLQGPLPGDPDRITN